MQEMDWGEVWGCPQQFHLALKGREGPRPQGSTCKDRKSTLRVTSRVPGVCAPVFVL